MHGMHCLPLQFLNILVHCFFCFSVSSLHSSTHGWGPRFVSTAAYFLSDLDKKMETHWGCIVWMRGIQHLDLFLIQTWTTFKMLVLVSFHTLNKNKIPPVGRWKHFFFMQPFLRYKAFMWTVYFLKPNLIFLSFSWWVWFIHCFVDLSINSFLSFFFGSSYGYAASPRAVVHDLKFCTKKWTVVTHSCYSQLMHF